MTKYVIRECVNRSCNNVLYIPYYKKDQCLQCQECIDKKRGNDTSDILKEITS